MRFLTKELIQIFLLTFALALGIQLIQPLFPLFIQDLEATVLEVSMVVFASGVLASFIMVPSGVAADRFGRRRLVSLAFIMALTIFFYTFATRWEYVIPWAMIFSASFSVFLPARMAFIADHTTPKTRAVAYSIANTAWPVGGILGPSLAGLMVEKYGWNTLFYTVTLMFLICLPVSLKLRERSIIPEDKAKPTMKVKTVIPQSLSEDNRSWLYISSVFFLLMFFSGLGNGSISTIFPIYLNKTFLLGKSQVGFFLSMGFGMGALISQIPSAILTNKFGKKPIFLLSLITTPIFMFLMPLMNSYLSLLIVYVLFYFFWSMSWPVSISLLMDLTPSSKRGIAAAVRSTGFRVGNTIGPLVGGILWIFFSPSAVFSVASIFLLTCIPVLLLLSRITRF